MFSLKTVILLRLMNLGIIGSTDSKICLYCTSNCAAPPQAFEFSEQHLNLVRSCIYNHHGIPYYKKRSTDPFKPGRAMGILFGSP